MVDVLKGVLDQHIQNSIIKLQIWDDQFLKLTRSVVEPVIKLDSNGNITWQKTIANPFSCKDG